MRRLFETTKNCHTPKGEPLVFAFLFTSWLDEENVVASRAATAIEPCKTHSHTLTTVRNMISVCQGEWLLVREDTNVRRRLDLSVERNLTLSFFISLACAVMDESERKRNLESKNQHHHQRQNAVEKWKITVKKDTQSYVHSSGSNASMICTVC